MHFIWIYGVQGTHVIYVIWEWSRHVCSAPLKYYVVYLDNKIPSGKIQLCSIFFSTLSVFFFFLLFPFPSLSSSLSTPLPHVSGTEMLSALNCLILFVVGNLLAEMMIGRLTLETEQSGLPLTLRGVSKKIVYFQFHSNPSLSLTLNCKSSSKFST